MELLDGKKNILWDFDGVILDSMVVRGEGFKRVLADYPQSEVEKLLEYHQKNGGLSRYVKFRYFLEEIRKEEVTEEKIQNLAEAYSEIMRASLTSKDRLIEEVVDFISKNHQKFEMHLVSGSDGDELRFLCGQLELSGYFKTIQGSPTPKIDLVKRLMTVNNYAREETCLIGDSINDYDAAKASNIQFYGYNNPGLKERGLRYINSFSQQQH